MEVFILEYSDYDEHSNHGVFSSRENAEKYKALLMAKIKRYSKESKKDYLQRLDRLRSLFDVESYIIDAAIQ